VGVSKDCPNFLSIPIRSISGTRKATNFKFGRLAYSYRVHPNKSPLKIWEKRERGRIQEVPNFLEYPLLSQELVKLRTSNFVRTWYRSEQTPSTNFGKSSRGIVRTLKIFRGTIWAHFAVVFAIARLSCLIFRWCLQPISL